MSDLRWLGLVKSKLDERDPGLDFGAAMEKLNKSELYLLALGEFKDGSIEDATKNLEHAIALRWPKEENMTADQFKKEALPILREILVTCDEECEAKYVFGTRPGNVIERLRELVEKIEQ